MDLESKEMAENADMSTQRHEVQFTGNVRSYFSIWIVNILLTIATLGIYSAWATVRNKQYFFGHTLINGHRFDYLATPLQILKGRLLAVACFTLYIVASSYYPMVGILLVMTWLVALPWVINQGLRFNLRMTRYRNVQFSFKGCYKDAFVNFVLLPVLSIFTLYLLLPWVLKRIDSYIHNNIHYGNKKVITQLSTREYYLIAFACLCIAIGIVIAVGVLALVTGASFTESPQMIVGLILLMQVSVITILAPAYQAMVRNHIYSNSHIEGIAEFESSLEPVDYVTLTVTNTVAIVLTLGLAFPWAKVRKAKMLAAATVVHLQPDAEKVINVQQAQQSSFAQEAANVFDVDVSLT
ncbi:YjgN family protein [Pseudoalteromonas sp. T1lg23B]|uniref:YjgN family protein n=1 Tax=Pseudoalteromonas sp. T1lg23B TaxID=2077097 RepID=UPI000CF64C76|nr:YjgN family protein [Pseudoalteromonas sp. T1lg23B]